VSFGKRILKKFSAGNIEQEYCEMRHETKIDSAYVQVLQQPGEFQFMAVRRNTQLKSCLLEKEMVRSLMLQIFK
jgi:hypothetical protein